MLQNDALTLQPNVQSEEYSKIRNKFKSIVWRNVASILPWAELKWLNGSHQEVVKTFAYLGAGGILWSRDKYLGAGKYL